MRVGFDAHMVGRRETGNETYALGLLEGFAELGFGVDAYHAAFLEAHLHRRHRVWPNNSAVRIPVCQPLMSLRDRLDLWHATYVLSPVAPCPQVVTVHDLTFALFPQWFDVRVREMLGRFVPMSLRKATMVIAISDATRRDLIRLYGVPERKIAVTYLAPRLSFRKPVFGIPRQPFFLYVGNITKRKNLEVLAHAMYLLRKRGQEIKLLVAGHATAASLQLSRLLESLDLINSVTLLGYQSDGEVLELYRTCTALVHPALYEGFGLTVIEAMAQGTPVISSDRGALPEVVGDSGILLPPDNPEAWSDAMSSVLTDSGLREKLSECSRERSRLFSWEKCARETVSVYESVLRRPSGII